MVFPIEVGRVLVDREHAQFRPEDVEEVDDGISVVSGVEDLVQVETIPLELPEVRDNSPQIREAFRRMNRVDLDNIFRNVFREKQKKETSSEKTKKGKVFRESKKKKETSSEKTKIY